MTQFEKAVRYAKQGVKVFPVGSNKKPLVEGGDNFEKATTDLRTVKKWWKKYPNAMIAASNDQFVVIDMDDHKLADGFSMKRTIFEKAVQSLKDRGIIESDSFISKTISGGTHVYFKSDIEIKRSIKCLPYMDLLGLGGYSVLPDQVNYKTDRTDTPWDDLLTYLTDFKYAEFSYTVDEFAPVMTELRKLDTDNPAQKTKKKDAPNYTQMKTDIDGIKIAKEFSEQTGKMAGSIDYDAGGDIEFAEQTPDTLYKKTENEHEKADPNQKMVIDGQSLIIDEGMLNGERINELFHNVQIQKMMAERLGLKKTPVGGSKLMHSLLPKHTDSSPSMGIRWSEDETHIIVRDFANFFGAKHNYCDYNLVRLYATTMYKGNVQRLSPAEFVVWFTRLLHESGVIDLSHVMPKYYKPMKNLGKSERKVAESILLLEACKRLYGGYDGTTTFSDKFSAAWSGVSASTIGRVKKSLTAKGYLEYAGVYDCSGGKRKDKFYETPLYKVATEAKAVRITDVITDKSVLELQERGRQKLNEEKRFDTVEQEVNDKYPNLGTIYGMPITDMSYEKVLNFCEDFGISTPVMKQNMFMPVFYSTDFIDDVINDTNRMFFANNFELVIDDQNEQGYRPLIAIGDSDSYADAWKEINQKHREHKQDGFEEPSPHFVVAFDVSDMDIDDEELDRMTLKFNEYVNDVSFQGVRTRYLNEPQMEQVLDGMMDNME